MSDAGEHLDSTVLRRWTLGLLAAQALLSLLALGYGHTNTIGGLQIVLFMPCATAVLMWIQRACHNARVKSPDMRPTPGWAVAWYFIPLANLLVPLLDMREIWRHTAEQAGQPDDRGGLLLIGWWVLWLTHAAAAPAQYNTFGVFDAQTQWLNASLDCLMLLLCAVFALIVLRLSDLQRRAFEPPAAIPAGA